VTLPEGTFVNALNPQYEMATESVYLAPYGYLWLEKP
jgi:hypothetical protein